MNLIECMNFMTDIVNKFDEYIEKIPDKKTITLNDLQNIKDTYVQLHWIQKKYIILFDNITNVKIKYEKRIDPIVQELEYVITNEISSKYLNGENPIMDITCTSSNNIPINCNNWNEKQECYTIIDELVFLRELGYPGDVNNIDTIKDIIFNPQYSQSTEEDNNTTDKKNNIIGSYKYNCSGIELILPIINSANNIPPNLYYYKGDETYESGIYCRVGYNLVVKIPDIVVISDNTDYSKKKTVKCDKIGCNSRKCNYAHPGESYRKIGYKRRCPSLPRFSNFKTLQQDIKFITFDDIQLMLIYSTTDMLATYIWCQKNEHDVTKTIIMDDIHTCEESLLNPLIQKNHYK